MTEKKRPTREDLLADPSLLTAAITRGVHTALLQHARAGQPVAIWQDGQVVWLQPTEILAYLAGASGVDKLTVPVALPTPGASTIEPSSTHSGEP